jgi:outer membrane protein assembly factor BamB
MRKSFILLCAVALVAGCKPSTASTTDTPPQDSVPPAPRVVVPRFASPEGAAWDGTYLYISNVGQKLDPMNKDGDGFILRLNAEGTAVQDSALFAALKLDAPKGMAVLHNRLYVTDIDRVVVIDLATVQQVDAIDLSGTGAQFCNDIAVKDDSTLFVSATDQNAIYEVDLIRRAYKKLPIKGLNGPNGLHYESEEGKIYCAEYGGEEADGRLLAIDARGGQTQVLHSHRGSLDGLVRLRNGNLVFSDWNSKSLHQLDLRSNTLTRIALDSIQGPADLGYSTGEDRLWIPCMMENRLQVIENAQSK